MFIKKKILIYKFFIHRELKPKFSKKKSKFECSMFKIVLKKWI
jgi:hypothetical protein